MQYEYMDQYINYHATQPASGFYNNDKYIATNFVECRRTVHVQSELGSDARGALLGAPVQGCL